MNHLKSPYDDFVDEVWMAEPGAPIGGIPELAYCVGSLCGEAGEAWEKVKKCHRDANATWTEETLRAFVKELGDAQFYIVKAAHSVGLTHQDVIEANVDKLRSRLDRGTLHGNGDDR